MPDAVLYPGRSHVRQERLVIRLALGRGALDLLRTAVVAGVRIDGHDAHAGRGRAREQDGRPTAVAADLDDLPLRADRAAVAPRSEEHTSELQSRRDLVCRLL